MGLTGDFRMVLILFFLYGIYAAATEGVAKALISNLVPKRRQVQLLDFMPDGILFVPLLPAV